MAAEPRVPDADSPDAAVPDADSPDADSPDADLLAAHVAGHPDAFGWLFTRHRDRLWAVALRTMGNPDDAADGLQDALVAAYRRAGSFRGEAAVTTWLHRVVVNACLDRIRAAASRRTEPLPDDLEEYGARGALASSTRAGGPSGLTGSSEAATLDPALATEQGEDRARILAALATLPAEQRAAIVLVDMEGYPVAEVAVMLDCAVGTVKSRCSRGRARLATLLRDLLPGETATDAVGSPPRNRPPVADVPSSSPPRGPPHD